MDVTSPIAMAYDSTGGAWERGAGRIYNHLADVVVDHAALPLAGRVLDVGAGTGAASRAIARRGARPIALDAAYGMLADDAARRPPAVVGDARRLPFAEASIDGVVACFSLNHLQRPVDALAELRRVCRPGSPIVASAYATDDGHPVKVAVERVLTEHGWRAPTWYTSMRQTAIPLLATTERAAAVARQAELSATVRHVDVPMEWLTPSDLVEWRFGMAQVAPYLARLPVPERDRLRGLAVGALGDDQPPLRRSIIIISAIV